MPLCVVRLPVSRFIDAIWRTQKQPAPRFQTLSLAGCCASAEVAASQELADPREKIDMPNLTPRRGVSISGPAYKWTPTTCCWPNCEASVSEFPLCIRHALDAYRMVNSTIQAVGQAMRDVEPAEDSRTGWVYFVRYRDRIKIGYSIDPRTRIQAHPVDEVLAIVPGERIDEKRMHTAFAHLRENGEWFRAEPELLDYARTLTT